MKSAADYPTNTATTLMIDLPTSPLPATRSNPRLLLIYGPPKVGKTAAVAALPDTLILECEPGGADHVAGLKYPKQGCIETLDEFFKVLAAVRQANDESEKTTGKPRYPRIAIDTVDQIESWCEGEATISYRKSPVGRSFTGQSVLQLDKGAGYSWLRTEFRSVLTMIQSAAYEVILIGHIRDKMLTVNASEVSAKDLDLTGKIRNICCALSDAIGCITRTPESKLMLNFKTNEQVNCGSRCAHLKGQVIELGSMVDGETRFNWERVYLNGSVEGGGK